MAHFDLVCKDCGKHFELVTGGAIREKQKRCPDCSSKNIRQSFASYLRNGSLSNPNCGEYRPSSGYG